MNWCKRGLLLAAALLCVPLTACQNSGALRAALAPERLRMVQVTVTREETPLDTSAGDLTAATARATAAVTTGPASAPRSVGTIKRDGDIRYQSSEDGECYFALRDGKTTLYYRDTLYGIRPDAAWQTRTYEDGGSACLVDFTYLDTLRECTFAHEDGGYTLADEDMPGFFDHLGLPWDDPAYTDQAVRLTLEGEELRSITYRYHWQEELAVAVTWTFAYADEPLRLPAVQGD